ncbi:MAG: PKD domain-containing protein, partial [Flavobacteriales bacterium]|nr:PKD domain-containing protein [Flavobacteriales bacterium]
GTYDVSLVGIDDFGCSDTMKLTDVGNPILISEPFSHYTYTPMGGGCIPLTISFSDNSKNLIGSIASWNWGFGDTISGTSNYSSLQYPTHTFDSAGVYWITLTVITDRGCTDTFDTLVRAGYPPDLIDFTMSDSVKCHGQLVSFTDLSQGLINQWTWNFGDGTYPSFAQNPDHEFQATGLVWVTLTAGLNGCTSSLTKPIQILPPAPDFSVSPWLSCGVPHQVTFTDMSVGAETWLWDFDDGNSSNDANVVHTFTSYGLYHVKLIVTNTNGCTDSQIHQVRIPKVIANFGATDTEECFSLTTSFKDSSTFEYTNYNPRHWYWDFGDGTTYSSNDHWTKNPPPHVYSDTGSYDVMLVVTEKYGCKDTMVRNNFITVHGVYPNYGADIEAGCAPLQVHFTDSTMGTSPLVSWSWDFGDGSPISSLNNPTHSFGAGSPYNVQLTVLDANGCIDSLEKPGLISPTFIYPAFSCKSAVCLAEDAGIVDSSLGAGISYSWDFGDGYTTSSPNPSHGYSNTGVHTIVLTLSDINGCVLSKSQTIEVFPQPIPGFSVDSLSTSCPPLVATFTDTSSTDVATWSWDFGDNTGSAGSSPMHTYTYPGTYDITLNVTTAVGCTETVIFPDLLVVGGPTGSINFTPVAGCVPLDVTFTATCNNTIQYKWDYGDGVIDTLSGPSAFHQYVSVGVAHPLLIMKDSMDCEREALKPAVDSIIIDGAVAHFTSDSDTVYTTLCSFDTSLYSFTDSSYTQNIHSNITSWFWDFDDMSTSNQMNTTHIYSDTGIYMVKLTTTSTYGCVVSDSLEIVVLHYIPNPIQATIINFVNVNCFGVAEGSASVSISGGLPPYNIKWDDDSTQITATADSLLAGNYMVLVMDVLGCKDSDTVSILQPSNLIAQISSSSKPSCNGADDGWASYSVYGGTPPYTYQWNDPLAQSTDTASFLVADTIALYVTDSLDCIAVDTLIISQPDSLRTQPVIINVGCKGDSTGQVIASTSGGTEPYSFVWNTVSVQSDSVAFNLIIGLYSVIVTDTMGCIDSFKVTISEPESLISVLGIVDPIMCFGDSTGKASTTATGGTQPYTYSWFPSGGEAPIGTGLWSGMHSYMVVDSQGCSFLDSVFLTQPPKIIVSTAIDDTICEFESAEIFASTIGGTGNYTYSWNSGLPAGSGPFIVHPDTSIQYNVSVIDANGCIVKDSLTITVYELLTLSLSSNVFCVNENSSLIVSIVEGARDDQLYHWDFGDGHVESTSETTIEYIYPDTGSFNIKVLSDPVRCVIDSIDIEPIQVNISPQSKFSANPLVLPSTDPRAWFTDESESGAFGVALTSWNWNFGDGSFDNSVLNPTHKYQDTGTFMVELIVSNEYSCMDTDYVEIRVTPGYAIQVPNAFTPNPNGPVGGIYNPVALNNDIFFPTTGFVDEYHMMVFNRWGELIFESFDLGVGWDGYYRGILCQQDAYVWKIELVFGNGVEYKKIGDVTLLR